MSELVSRFSDTIHIVNEDLINCRKKEDMVEYVIALCKEVEKMLGHHHIEFLDCVPDDSNYQIREINKAKNNKKKKSYGTIISTEETYARAYNFKFKLKYNDETRLSTMKIYIPLICEDGINYLIKGNKYCAPFQLVDAVTYNHHNPKLKFDEVCLKTEVQDIHMQRFKNNITDVDGVTYTAYRFNIKLNRFVNKVPFLLFYFATFGFFKTLEYFGIDNPGIGIRIFEELPPITDPWRKYYLFFKYGSVYISVRREAFLNSGQIRDLITTILATKKRSINSTTICDVEHWTQVLGTHLSQSNPMSSGESLKITFYNSLNPRTSQIIKTFIGKELNTIYAVVRWMFTNYSINVSKDNSLNNKRLRLSEYLINPLKQALKRKAYQFNRTRGGYRDIRRLLDVVGMSPMIIIDAINGKGKVPTAKFSNAVNDMTLANASLKGTQSGPDGGASGGYVPKEFKQLHPSMAGKTDLISTSVNAPGVNITLLPNCKIDVDTLGFVD